MVLCFVGSDAIAIIIPLLGNDNRYYSHLTSHHDTDKFESYKRAGADLILTYFAKEVALMLRQETMSKRDICPEIVEGKQYLFVQVR
ncbi:hypothetical protein GS682_19800 [Nostoc sp. B(2019)]|nr:hypothetical protein [Nostoc sp. B(2019)]